MDHPVLLFDGVCNLCNGTVTFILHRDPEGVFRFAALQSEYGEGTLARLGLPTVLSDTVVLVDGDGFYTKSDAALQVVRRLSGLWPLLYAFIIIPRPIRNFVYDLIARNRYRLFGKRAACMVPTPDLQARFLG